MKYNFSTSFRADMILKYAARDKFVRKFSDNVLMYDM